MVRGLMASAGFASAMVIGLAGGASPALGGAPAVTRGDDQPTSALARAVVFEVTVQYSTAPVALPIQSGFLVGPEGVGVTSYSSLHSAKGATAKFVDSPITYKVDVLTAEPTIDLALVKLTPQTEGSGVLEKFLPLAPGDLQDRQPVWTLKASASTMESDATAGIADVHLRKLKGIGSEEKDQPFEAPAWIYSRVSQDRRSPGFPLVDERGRLVGINVWAWPTGQDKPMALTGTVVDQLLNKYKDEVDLAAKKKQPPPVVPIASLRTKYHDDKLVGSTFPRLSWPEGRDNVENARGEANRLADSVRCQECKGVGTREDRITTTTSGGGRRPGTTSFDSKKITCEKCEGKKLTPNVWPIAARTAKAIANASQGSEKFDDVLVQLKASMEEVNKLNGSEFLKRLNEEAREHLTLKKLKRGDPVMFTGSLSDDAALREWDKDVQRVNVPWDNRAGILVVSPETQNLNRGQGALFVGVVSGFVTVRRDEHWIVLERVSAVPLGGYR